MEELGEAILIVDDEENVLSSLRRLLRPDGYRIFTASGAEQALEILSTNPIALVISDNAMPGTSGIELLRRVRESWPDVIRVMLTGYADLQSATAAINQDEVYRFVSKPWDPQEFRLMVRQAVNQFRLVQENRHMHQLIQEQNRALKGWNESLQQAVEQRTQEIRSKNAELERLYSRLKASFFNTIKVFTGFIELRNPSFGGHARRVTLITRSICRELKLNEELSGSVEIAALLHDIGKISLPDELLRRDERFLNMKERSLLEQHPVMGQAVLQTIDDLEAIALMVRHHHERWDGRGYPDRLQGEAIPLGARIIAVANAFDHHQQSKVGSAMDFVEGQLVQGAGGAFDPSILAALERATQIPSEATRGREIALNVLELKEGMVTSRDVTTHSGMLIVPRGEPLRPAILSRLSYLARQKLVSPTVYVYG